MSIGRLIGQSVGRSVTVLAVCYLCHYFSWPTFLQLFHMKPLSKFKSPARFFSRKKQTEKLCTLKSVLVSQILLLQTDIEDLLSTRCCYRTRCTKQILVQHHRCTTRQCSSTVAQCYCLCVVQWAAGQLLVGWDKTAELCYVETVSSIQSESDRVN